MKGVQPMRFRDSILAMRAYTPNSDDSACVCARLRRGARALTLLYDETLAPAGLTVAQFSLLRHIERLGPVGVQALARATGHERSTLARTLRPLERAAWIEIQRGTDRRRREACLTDAGRATLKRAHPLWQRAQERAVARLGSDRDTLFTLLDQLERAPNEDI